MVLVDSCVLIDVLVADSLFAEISARTLGAVAERHDLAVNPLIYAELSPLFSTPAALEDALLAAGVLRLGLPYEAAFLAGRAFAKYRRNGGNRRSPLPDFYIGAHAAVLGCALVTRDIGRYQRYFPSVELITPG